MNEIPESELWECSTCKQPHPIETDYECASCGMLASEHISVTAMCRIIREWQSRAYSAELKLARIERERDEARSEIEKLKEELESHAWTISPAMAQAKIDELVEQRDKALTKIENQAERIKCLEGATNHATGTPLSKMREQRDRLAEAGKILAEEYEDRRSQWGGWYLWQKYEDAQRVDAAIAVFTAAVEGGSDEARSDLEFLRDLFQIQGQRLNDVFRERDEARTKYADEKALADRLAMSAQVLVLTLNAFTEGMASEIGADSLRQWREARSPE
jgi:hypothetical protein